MGAANAKSTFTFYNDIKVHKCKNEETEKSVYYKYQSGLASDLAVVTFAEKYKKKIIRIPSNCTCSGNIVQLEIHKQMAVSNKYIPDQLYEYKTKQMVDTGFGFNYWLHSITRDIWQNDSEFDLFISGLVPGVLFYDGGFIGKITEKILQKLNFENPKIKTEPEFLDALKKFINYAQEMKTNSVVTNAIYWNKL